MGGHIPRRHLRGCCSAPSVALSACCRMPPPPPLQTSPFLPNPSSQILTLNHPLTLSAPSACRHASPPPPSPASPILISTSPTNSHTQSPPYLVCTFRLLPRAPTSSSPDISCSRGMDSPPIEIGSRWPPREQYRMKGLPPSVNACTCAHTKTRRPFHSP